MGRSAAHNSHRGYVKARYLAAKNLRASRPIGDAANMSVLVREKRNSADSLEAFAKRIETMLRKGGATDSIERLICRLMTGEDLKVAAALASKWVEWKYGKPKETLRIEERTPIDPGTDFFQAKDTTGLGKPN